MKNGERLINKIIKFILEIFCEHFASVRGQEGLQRFASIFLRRPDLASFASCNSPAVEGLVFCRAGAILFKFARIPLTSARMATRSWAGHIRFLGAAPALLESHLACAISVGRHSCPNGRREVGLLITAIVKEDRWASAAIQKL